MTELDRITAHVDAGIPSSLKRLFALIRIPSVSTEAQYAPGCRRAAEWLRDELLNGTTTFFCDNHTIGNVMDVASVGDDSHNIILAGINEDDMALALATIEEVKGDIVVVHDGVVTAFVGLPIAGLLSDKRVHEVATENQALKTAGQNAGCTNPYMGFNLIPLLVIPKIRITDKGVVKVPEMMVAPLYD